MGTSDSKPQATPEAVNLSSTPGLCEGQGHVSSSLHPTSALGPGSAQVGAGDTHFLPPLTDIDGQSDYCKCYGIV